MNAQTQRGTCYTCKHPIAFTPRVGWEHTEELEAVFDGPWGEHRPIYATQTDTPANLTYIRHRVREGIPNVPRAWENFAESVERACNELQDYREVLGPLVEAAKAALEPVADAAQEENFRGRVANYKNRLEIYRLLENAIAKAEGREP